MKQTSRTLKIALFAALIAAFISITVIGSVPAYAQSATGTPAPTQPANPSDATQPTVAVRMVRQIARALLEATIQETKLEQRAILRDLAAGKTFKDIIATAKGSVDNVKAAASKTLTDQINQAVKDGKLTQAEADKLLASLDETLTKAINGDFRGQFSTLGLNGSSVIQGALRRVIGSQVLFSEVSRATGLSQRDLIQQIRGGKTLAQIATENKADPAQIVKDAVTVTTRQINRLVTAKRVKQEDADKLIAQLPQMYTDIMNSANPLSFNGGKFGPRTPKPSATGTPTGPATPSL